MSQKLYELWGIDMENWLEVYTEDDLLSNVRIRLRIIIQSLRFCIVEFKLYYVKN